MPPRHLSLDIVVDFVCPWCLVGEARLQQALLERPDVKFELKVRPFQLDPTTPREGRDLRAWLSQRYGTPPEGMFARVEQAAAETGIPLDFTKVTRQSNTLAAHVLVRHANEKGNGVALTQALFNAYFLEGIDIGDPHQLAKLASKFGFEEDEVIALLDDDTEREAVRTEALALGRQGISGVPFFIFGGTHALSGAQPKEHFLRAIDAALEQSE